MASPMAETGYIYVDAVFARIGMWICISRTVLFVFEESSVLQR